MEGLRRMVLNGGTTRLTQRHGTWMNELPCWEAASVLKLPLVGPTRYQLFISLGDHNYAFAIFVENS